MSSSPQVTSPVSTTPTVTVTNSPVVNSLATTSAVSSAVSTAPVMSTMSSTSTSALTNSPSNAANSVMDMSSLSYTINAANLSGFPSPSSLLATDDESDAITWENIKIALRDVPLGGFYLSNEDPTEEEIRRHKSYYHKISNALSQALDLNRKHDQKTIQMVTAYKDILADILEEANAQQKKLDEKNEETLNDNIASHVPVPPNDDYFKEPFPLRALRSRSEAVSGYANNKRKYNEKKEVCPALLFNSIQASCRESQASIRAVAKLGLMSQTVLSNVAAQAERSAYSSTAMRYVVENAASMDFCIDALKVATGPDSEIQQAIQNLGARIDNISVPLIDNNLVMTAIAKNEALNEFIEKKIEEKTTSKTKICRKAKT